MPCKVEYDATLPGVVATVSGRLDNDVYRAMVREVASLLKAHGAGRVALDLRGAELAMTALQVYSAGDEYELAGLAKVRRALVAKAIDADLAFHEQMSARRGHVVRIFTDMAEARGWLAEEPALRPRSTK